MDPPLKQQLSEQTKPRLYQTLSEQLPETDFPNEDNLCRFFKVKTRVSEDYMNVQMGVLALKFNRFQEDFVTYLANLLMCQCEYLNVFIVDPMHLYISMNMAFETNSSSRFSSLQLQSDVYHLLDFCRVKISEFFSANVSEAVILGENSESAEQITAKFQSLCIKPMNETHSKIFSEQP